MSYAERSRLAKEHEQLVRDVLEREGWQVAAFGQEHQNSEVRSLLKRSALIGPTMRTRWIPDLLCWKAGNAIILDPKGATNQETPNWAVEAAAVDALADYFEFENRSIPTWVVFPNLTVATPDEIRTAAPTVFRGRGTGGSGTDFRLVPRDEFTTQLLDALADVGRPQNPIDIAGVFGAWAARRETA